MARCWTCGIKWEQTAGDYYICESCEEISNQVRSLEKTGRDEVSNLIYVQREGFDLLRDSMQEIASVIEWGFGELSWQIQQQTDVLHRITEILEARNATDALEWRQMAEEHRERARATEEHQKRDVYDEAIKFFRKSLRANSLDYRTYIGLGETYLQIGKFSEAKNYFEKSLPYAPSDFYKSYSHRLIGRIYYCWEDYDNAIKSLTEAVEFSPSYVEARYDLAQYYGIVGKAKTALPKLRRVIMEKSFYFKLSEKERNFEPIRIETVQLHEDIKKEAYEDAQKAILAAKDALDEAETYWGKIYEIKEDRKIRSELNRAMNKAASGDYESILEAKPIARDVFEIARSAKEKCHDVEIAIMKLKEDKRAEFGRWNKTTILHASSLITFTIGFAGAFSSLTFLLLLLPAGILEAIAEDGAEKESWRSCHDAVLFLAPICCISGLLKCLSSFSDIREKHVKIFWEVLDGHRRNIEGFWTENE